MAGRAQPGHPFWGLAAGCGRENPSLSLSGHCFRSRPQCILNIDTRKLHWLASQGVAIVGHPGRYQISTRLASHLAGMLKLMIGQYLWLRHALQFWSMATISAQSIPLRSYHRR